MENNLATYCWDFVLVEQEFLVAFVVQHQLQEVKASRLSTEVVVLAPTKVVVSNSLDIKFVDQDPTKDTGCFIEVVEYFSGDTEVVDGRVDYTKVVGWANYYSNFFLEGILPFH